MENNKIIEMECKECCHFYCQCRHN